MDFLKKFVNAGITDETPPDVAVILRTNIIVSANLVFLILIFLAIFMVFVKGLTLLLFIASLVLITGIAFQYLQLHVIGRVLNSVVVCAVALVLSNFYLNQTGQDLLSLRVVCAMLALFPLFLFSIREFRYSMVAFLLNLFQYFMLPRYARYFKMEGDISYLGAEWLQVVTLLAGLFIVAAMIVVLQMNSRNQVRRSEELIANLAVEKENAESKQLQMNKLLEELKAKQAEEQKIAWASEGLAEAGKILRQYADLNTLSDKLVSFLVKFVNANQGAIFFLFDEQGDKSYLRLTGCYAYDRKKFVDKTIDSEEGLIGECLKSRDFIYLTEVPKNYVHITSGLGLATPRSLLLIPVTANESAFGVIEMASFEKFEKYQIQFLSDVGEMIATAFNNIKSSERTKQLLEESIQMSELMKSQEEEMRQNMEELASIQEAQARTEQELRQQLVEKERRISDLETQFFGMNTRLTA